MKSISLVKLVTLIWWKPITCHVVYSVTFVPRTATDTIKIVAFMAEGELKKKS